MSADIWRVANYYKKDTGYGQILCKLTDKECNQPAWIKCGGGSEIGAVCSEWSLFKVVVRRLEEIEAEQSGLKVVDPVSDLGTQSGG